MIDFVHNFQVFLTDPKCQQKMSQKMRNVLKRIFEYRVFIVQFLVYELWSILYFTFLVHLGPR